MKADETKRKREILLGINPCIYGLNYHDPAVVVLIDGRVVFGVEEERCNRVKHSNEEHPVDNFTMRPQKILCNRQRMTV